MNLRNAENYSIGLDLGVGSVGWAVTDESGVLLHVKGRPAYGSRLFPEADSAAETRLKRGQRRRYNRRRQRIDTLQGIFAEEMAKTDPEFFIRLRQSRLWKEDRNPHYATDYTWPLFNESDFTEREYYKAYPTIWHLRRHLMEEDERADIRLVYLALHNIVKYRGNFLQEDNPSLSAKNANAREASHRLVDVLLAYTIEAGSLDIEAEEFCAAVIEGAIEDRSLRRADKEERIAEELSRLLPGLQAKAIAKACTGVKAEFSNALPTLEKGEGTSFRMSDDEKADSFRELCGDEELAVFDAIASVYSAYVLSGLLQGCPCLSEAMIRSYEQHSSDLAVAKHLTKKYLGAEVYRALFKGPKTQDGRYDINRLPKNSYTAYILGDRLSTGKGCTQEDFIKNLRKQFEGSDELQEDADFLAIKDRLYADDGRFLAKQKTRLNGAIPYQLHLEEMQAIIDKQERFYPFLGDNRDLLKKIVSSRIPYYVGPLNNGHDPHAPYKSNAVDASRKFAWSVRKKGMEHVKAYPWNVDEVIDTDLTAERFIRRMTGTCSYLYGEPVLPRHSLLYEEFCVLNELNSAKWCEGGGEPHRFTSDDRADMMEELFKKRKSVPHKAVADWLLRRGEAEHAFVSGTQDEETFKSQLVSYNDFRKILCVKTLEDENCPLKIEEIEEIILWNTVFEDRDILRRKLVEAYGDKLSPSQINKIVKIRYTGWGRLSRKFLTGIKTKTVFGSMSIMDIMRDGDPITGHHAQAMNLMEVLHSDDFGFQGCVDEENEEYFKENNRELTVDDMQGSPALRRSVNQAMRILDELVSIAGKAPACICIESTREEDGDKKGRRTHSRYDSLKNAIRQLKSDAAQYDPELLDDLERSKSNLDNEKLVLYFMQGGKSLYSGNDLDINRLGEYQVDHILPQSYIKDDSFDNKALVLQEENQRKRDSLLLDNSIINSQTRRWKELNRVGLISDKKLRNLTCRSLSERRLTGFVNRQLVETSQVIKFVRQMCEQHYPDTEIISVRASLSHGLREKFGLVKSRVMNDYHHAHDAYLACQVARFMSIRYPKWQNGFDVAVLQKYIKSLSDAFERDKKTPGQSGFVVDSFARTAADEKTGEIIWDAEYEIGRIRKELSYKDCFISRMPEEQTGAFWKETIISPRAKRNPNVPQKVSGKEGYLNPKRYGGFETTLSAYFFIFAALDKKGSRKFFFEGVPVHLANRVAEKPEVLNEWAAHIASQKGCHDAVVLRKRIPLRQKLRIGDSLFSLGGRTGKYNVLRAVVEIGGNLKLADVLNRCEDGEAIITQEEAEFAYEELSREIAKTCPELSRALKLDAFYESFSSISREEQKAVLVNVANSANGVKQNCDLSFLGGSSQAACIRKNIASYLSQITWIDTSVTGIFEKKTTFEDLIHGL